VSAIDLPQARRLAFGLVLGQAAVTVAAALCAWAVSGRRAAESAALGGGIATIGSLVMAGLVFGRRTGDPKRALMAFYLGEAVKMLVVIALFVAVLKLVAVAPLAMLATFAITVLVYWIVLIAALPGVGSVRGGV
jgi:ATP synthase protein I